MLKKKISGIIILLAISFSPVLARGETVQNWYKVCNKQRDSDVCNTINNTVSETGQYLTIVNLIQITGEKEERRISVQVPTGRLIPDGVTLKVDSGKDKKVPYVVCNSLVCIANDVFDEMLITAMKKGAVLTVTSVNFQGAKNPIPISLKGFSNVFDGPGMHEQDFKKEQEKLQKALRIKQKEIEERLRTEQEKGK